MNSEGPDGTGLSQPCGGHCCLSQTQVGNLGGVFSRRTWSDLSLPPVLHGLAMEVRHELWIQTGLDSEALLCPSWQWAMGQAPPSPSAQC